MLVFFASFTFTPHTSVTNGVVVGLKPWQYFFVLLVVWQNTLTAVNKNVNFMQILWYGMVNNIIEVPL